MIVTINLKKNILGEKLKAVLFQHTPGVKGVIRASDNRTDFGGVEVEVRHIYMFGTYELHRKINVNRF